MNAFTDVVRASLLNTTIVASALALVVKMLLEGVFVAAVGLLLPLVFLAYLTLTDAWLME